MVRRKTHKEDSRETQLWTVTEGTPLLNQIVHSDKWKSRNNHQRNWNEWGTNVEGPKCLCYWEAPTEPFWVGYKYPTRIFDGEMSLPDTSRFNNQYSRVINIHLTRTCHVGWSVFETDCQSGCCCDLPSIRCASICPQTVIWPVKMLGVMSLCCHLYLRRPNASFSFLHCL